MDFGAPSTGNGSCVDTVRALHQTIYALRTALEKSRDEILELKENSLSTAAVKDTIRNLSIENHVLRQKVVNTEEETKPKKVKRRTSKEKIDSYRNIDVNFEKNNRKVSRSCENVSIPESPRKLSKSRTVCFSNTFEDECQVSTCNSLHIPLLRREKSSKITKKNEITEDLDKSKARSKSSKLNKNSIFKEEIVNEDVTVSKNGSITDFVKENQNWKSTEKLIKHRASKTDEKAKDIKNKTTIEKKNDLPISKLETVQINRKIGQNSDRKTSEYQEISENSGIKTNEYHETSVTTIECKETSAKTIEYIKTIENNSTKKESREIKESIPKRVNDKTEKVDKNVKSLTDFNKTSAQLPTNDQELKKKKLKLINKDLAEFEGKIEAVEESRQADENTDRKAIECSEISENIGTKTIEREETDIKTIEYTKIIENRIEGDIPKQIGNSTGIADDIQTPLKKIDAISASQEETNSAQSNSNTSSETSSIVNGKKVEVSVKIYKGTKKPIEIDIQTKKKQRSPKKARKQQKMSNKSYEKAYPETVNRISTGNNIVTNLLQNDAEQEVDEVELIFTTDDTKETDFKEELVPIDAYAETQLLPCPLSDYDEKLEASDRELEDDVFNDNFENENQENCNFQSQTYDFRRENSQIYNSKSDNSINHDDKSFRSYYSYQDSSFENKSMEKDESFDRFEEKTRIIETDISKIGIQDVEYNLGRRNTCPNPIQYRPIMHREALGRGLNSRKCRPILAHSNVIRKESGAQTDISALPGSSWRSESSLGHKVKIGENFTTLPSKFPHPGSRLRLSEKTVEARRVLLSDIGFTSMVPELSRSADHLFPPVIKGPVVSSYGQFLRTTDLYSPAYTSQKFVWTTTTPSDGSHSQSRYSSQYPLASPPAPTRRCSAPVSPSKRTAVLKTTPSRVRFANGSLPELRGDWTATGDSGESTDSLVEEAEHFLRRSIDCLAPCKEICYRSETVKIGGRRASAPEPSRDNVPPQGWQPFLPRMPRDLHLDYWVKVISPEGRVRGGRIRYVGPLMNQPDAFVGVQLSTPDGHSDGTYNNRRYFNCEPYHGLFVPFKKIIMGWRP